MLDVDSIKDNVLTDIMENLGMDPGECDEKDLQVIRQMSASEAFDRFLIWNGIQGFTGLILETVDSLQNAETIAGLREILKGDFAPEGDIGDVWDAIDEVLSTQGHRNDASLKLVWEAYRQGNATNKRALALLKIKEIIG